ncbi:MAG: ribosome small subunit-dependent GTPase A [Lachnospiraceae bacterium]
MKGRIIKGIAGFYYVHTKEAGVYECKAKGIFRNQKKKPLVGDEVEIDILDETKKTGNITNLLPRKSELIRPAVANVDQAVVIFAADKPAPNTNLLDRFLLLMHCSSVPVVICFNKEDLVTEEKKQELQNIYESAGYSVIFTSAAKKQGIESVLECLQGKTSTVAGPSGVGKSSLINLIQPSVEMETGQISEKIERGKHTTRHSQLIYIQQDTYIMDTPGFSSIYLPQIEKEELWTHFPEFAPFEPQCRFLGCSHISEPDCGVKQALAEGKISQSRYDNYAAFYEEIKERKKY